MIVPPRRSRSKKGIAPLSVPPVRTTRLVPASTVPLVYVQLRPVRMVPTRLSVPEGLSMTRLGRAPAPGTAVAEPVNVWSSVPVDAYGAGPGARARGLVDRAAGGDGAEC